MAEELFCRHVTQENRAREECRSFLSDEPQIHSIVLTDNRQPKAVYVPGMIAVLMSPLRFSMCRNTCCSRDNGASPVM